MEEEKGKKKHWFFRMTLNVLAILGALTLFFGLSFGLTAFQKPTVDNGTILQIDLKGSIPEGPREDFLTDITQGSIISIWDIRTALKNAAKDTKIAGVRVLVQSPDIGWGAAEEIISEIDTFRKSKKPIYVLLQSDVLEDKDYFLATCGDQIWITPETAPLINGLAAEVTFWRGTLDKLRIEPEVIMYKEYKSAGEPLQNKEMSPYMREAQTRMMETIDARIKERVTAVRGVSADSMQELLNLGVATAGEMQRRGFVDRQGYLDEIEAELKDKCKVEKYKGISVKDYISSLENEETDGPRIAVVFGEGAILAQDQDQGLFQLDSYIYGPEMAGHIRDAADDDAVKAIILRVNSPGGSAVGSDVVLREIDRARGKGKPVIVSMSDMAGSGGYWISMHANKIVAEPTTVTGSIGVVFTKLNIVGFMDWIGANVDTVKTAPYADLLGQQPLDDDRKARFIVWMDDIYNSFVEKAADGRKMTVEEIEAIAKGRIWSGVDAQKKGLVDELGGIDEAIALAKKTAGLDVAKEYPLIVFPKPKSLIERLIEGSLFANASIPSKTAIANVAEELAQPKVLVKMPDMKIH